MNPTDCLFRSLEQTNDPETIDLVTDLGNWTALVSCDAQHLIAIPEQVAQTDAHVSAASAVRNEAHLTDGAPHISSNALSR